MPQDVKSFGVRTGSQGRHFRRSASEPPSGRPRADLRSPAVARCCGPGAKAPHATPPPCPRPPGLGAPPAIAWDSACDRSLAAASSPAGVALSPPPASPWIVRWRSLAWPNAPRVCLRARARSLGAHIHLPAPTEIWPFAPVGQLLSLAWLQSTAAMQRHFPVFPIGGDAVVPGHLRSPSGIGHIGPIAFVKTRSLL